MYGILELILSDNKLNLYYNWRYKISLLADFLYLDTGDLMKTRFGVAPYDLIQQDFRDMDSAETLRTTWKIERLILMQSVQGHAYEGHCRFHGTKYPNTTMDDISRALGLDPQVVRQERQELIDEISAYADKAIAGHQNIPLANDDGRGFLGSSIFHKMDLDPQDVLKGLYIGGSRDSTETRFAMEARYGVKIGGGKCYLVDTDVMNKMGLDGDILAHSEHENLIDYYKESGLIVADSGADTDDLEYMYIRHRRGPGGSDDTAIVAGGLIYGLGVAVGVFLADAIDTIEKYVSDFSDQDNNLAKRILAAKPDIGISFDELLRFTYISATPEKSDVTVPDSSLRHMMLIDRTKDMTAIESHFLFIQHKHFPKIRISHEEVPNNEFYDYVQHRVRTSPYLK